MTGQNSRFPQSRGDTLLLALLFALFAAITLVWLWLDRQPPNWDDAWYLTNSLVLYDALAHEGIIGWLTKFMQVMGFKAPLITALPTPLYLIFGRRWNAAFFVNIAAMFVMFVSLGRLAHRWSSSRAAWIAIWIAGTMPLLYGLARWYMVEYALAATVTLAVLLLVESEGLERAGTVFVFGLVCGLGMLLKASFALFAAPPFLYIWIRARRRDRALLIAGLPCAILALPWYALHFQATLQNAISAGFGQSAIIQGTGPIFTLTAIVTYLKNVTLAGISIHYAVLLLIAFAGLLIFRRVQLPPILAFWAMPFLVFVFGGNKDIRYIAPILPAAALAIALSVDRIVPQTWRSNAVLGFVLALPLIQMLAVSFGLPWRAHALVYARAYETAVWPLDEILTIAAAHTIFKPGEKKLLLIGSDVAGLNANNIELTALARQLPFAVETTAHENNLAVLQQRLDAASIFVFREGGAPESKLMNPHIALLAARVREDARFREIAFPRPVPDGSAVRMFHKPGRSSRLSAAAYVKAGLDQRPQFSVVFKGIIELSAFAASETSGSLVLKYRWSALARPPRDYWCFTHVMGPDGAVIGNLDHPLLDSDPPARSWTPGDNAVEEIRFALPPGVDSSKLHFKVGLYDPPSGERLRIDSLRATRFVLRDDSTAILIPFAQQ